MRTSLIIFCFCILVAVVHSAATSKAPVRQSAYSYLRTVRGKRSCASGTCPFWQKHGRSFVSLRCYSEQYQECTCLHRTCYSSCLFDRKTCDEEMVSCLQQICRRCLPAASAKTMCPAYDAMAERVVQSLKNFACYPCCGNTGGSNRNNSSNNVAGMTVTTPTINGSTRPVGNTVAGAVPPINGGNAGNRPNAGSITNTNRPNAAGTIPVNGVTRPTNNANTNRPSNGNQGTVNIPLQQIVGSANQRVKKPASTTRRIVTTIKRRSATARPTTRKN